MSGTITLATAQEQLSAWLDASLKLSKGLAVSINGRSITRPEECREWINYWSKIEASLLQRAAAGSTSDTSRGSHALARF